MAGPWPIRPALIGAIRESSSFSYRLEYFDNLSILTACQVSQAHYGECMVTLTPKQREMRSREQLILKHAVPIIRDGGLAALSMDAIAREIRCTRGTIYNHFPNKEDIALSLAARAVQRRLRLFEYAVTLSDQPRERMAAIGISCEVYADLMADDFLIEQMVRHDSVWPKTSEGRREVLLKCEQQCIVQVGMSAHEALACGDLQLPRGGRVEDIVFGLWSLVYGGLVLEATSPSLAEAGIMQARVAIRRNCNAMLDGLGWQPLYDASKYAKFVRRVQTKLEARAKEILADATSDSDDIDAKYVSSAIEGTR